MSSRREPLPGGGRHLNHRRREGRFGRNPDQPGPDRPDFAEARHVTLNPIVFLLYQVINIYIWLLIISVVMSWLVSFNVINTGNRFVYMVGDFLYRITEPLLAPVRRFLPFMGGLDISPVVLILLLYTLQYSLIYYFA
ncbi:MAG: YggT family protein [Alphaproteobacteria bacterium]|nr:YggT family protein [Alphaproteobacteria bacterium]